jgi:hypothetical protein
MMQSRIESDPSPDRTTPLPRAEQERRPYVAPALEPLGRWNALTLQQSVGISFDVLFTDTEW